MRLLITRIPLFSSLHITDNSHIHHITKSSSLLNSSSSSREAIVLQLNVNVIIVTVDQPETAVLKVTIEISMKILGAMVMIIVVA